MKRIFVFMFMLSMFMSSCIYAEKAIETVDNEKNHITNSLYEKLSDDEKEVVKVTYDIYDGIKNVELDKVLENCESLPESIVNDTKNFFKSTDDINTTCKILLDSFDYEIKAIKSYDESIDVNISYKYMAYNKVIKDALPNIIVQNIGDFVFKKLTNKTFARIVKNISDEIGKRDYEMIEGEYDLTFEYIDGKWKLVKTNEIILKLREYVKNLMINLF